MTTTRRFCADDLFRLGPTNMDPLTETYNMGFYLSYLTRWPDMLTAQENTSGRLMSYCIGKAEGKRQDWHGHVSVLTVAPEFRRMGLARTCMSELERVSDRTYKAYFVDLFVRCSNTVAIHMYTSFGYTVFRRVLGYYSGTEDAFDMRKACSRDAAQVSVTPLRRPVTTEELLNGTIP